MPSRETVIDLAPIGRHYIGRRRGGRFPVRHEVACESKRRSFEGRVLDLSQVGALVSLSQPEFCARTAQDLFVVAGRLAAVFAEVLTLHFVGRKVVSRARIVRVARQSAHGPTVIGCEFSRPLTFRECQLLGISTLTRGERAEIISTRHAS